MSTNALDRLRLRPPPKYPATPPKKLHTGSDENRASIPASDRYSAQEAQRLKQLDHTPDTMELWEAALVYYFRQFRLSSTSRQAMTRDIDRDSVHASKKLDGIFTKLNDAFGNALLSTAGPASCDHWLPRFIISKVCMHDWRAHMHNMKVDIMQLTIQPKNEAGGQKEERLTQLAAMKALFIVHMEAMVNKVKEAQNEADTEGQKPKWADARGDFQNADFRKELEDMKNFYSDMNLYEPVDNVNDLPPRASTYDELYGSGEVESWMFWYPLFEENDWAYGRSFFDFFRSRIDILKSLEEPRTADHMQWIFNKVCHEAWMDSTYIPIENSEIGSKNVMRKASECVVLTTDHKWVPAFVRQNLEARINQDKLPDFDEIFVWRDELSIAERKVAFGALVEVDDTAPRAKTRKRASPSS